MFLNNIKEFWVKKIVKKKLLNVNHLATNSVITKVGLIIDETYFFDKKELLNQLINNGLFLDNISVIVFRNVIKKNDNLEFPSF